MLKKKKFLIGGAIIVAAIALLSARAFAGSNVGYYNVGQLLEKGPSVYGVTVNVEGIVATNSVQRQAQGSVMTFTLASAEGGSGTLNVVYNGVVPSAFTEGGQLLCQGQLGQDGVFHANDLLTKCPSRYVAAPSG